MRTTVDIDAPILNKLKRLQEQRGESLGRLISDLLAQALAQRPGADAPATQFAWFSRPMKALVDLGDKEALLDAMDDRPE